MTVSRAWKNLLHFVLLPNEKVPFHPISDLTPTLPRQNCVTQLLEDAVISPLRYLMFKLTRPSHPQRTEWVTRKRLPLIAQKLTHFTWTRFLPFFCSAFNLMQGKEMTTISGYFSLKVVISGYFSVVAWNSSDYTLQFNHLISTEQDLCLDTNASCVCLSCLGISASPVNSFYWHSVLPKTHQCLQCISYLF